MIHRHTVHRNTVICVTILLISIVQFCPTTGQLPVFFGNRVGATVEAPLITRTDFPTYTNVFPPNGWSGSSPPQETLGFFLIKHMVMGYEQLEMDYEKAMQDSIESLENKISDTAETLLDIFLVYSQISSRMR